VYEAVLWDFGGVITTSPFDAFAAYERELGLPVDFIRRLNSTNPHTNAWAMLERGEVGRAAFAERFEAEAAAAGGELSGLRLLDLLAGDVRPQMVTALRRCKDAGLQVACLTNNFAPVAAPEPGSAGEGEPDPALEERRRLNLEREARIAEVMAMFDAIVESSKTGVRKPEPRFYAIACELLGVEPAACVFLDDLGVNLKPAREMGMATIKVIDAATALSELEALLGLTLT